jgi:hypothetical protein
MALLLKAGAPVRETAPVVAPQSAQPPARTASGRRNVAVDILRGYCIVMMIAGHTGTATYVNQGVHPLRFVSGAEGFVFLSGLVLGMVYRRKLDAAPAAPAYKSIWRRAGLLWLVHCVTVILAVSLNALLFRYPDIPSIRSVGLWRFLWLTITLRLQPGHGLNILPMYVFLLGAAPFAFEMLRRGKTALLLAISTGIFVYCQWDPGLGSWVSPLSGGDAFPPLAWQGLFIPGLILGYHHALVRTIFLARYRRTLMWGLGLACAATMILVSVQTPSFQFYNHEAWDLFLWERHPLRFGRVLYFLVSVSAFYLMAQAWWYRSRLPRFPLNALALLGRNSLYSFLVHLVFAFAAGALVFPPERWPLMEIVPVVSIAGVYLMARYQVGRRWIPN